MQLGSIAFGAITIDGELYREDIIIDGGQIKLRDKSASRRYKAQFGHTPLSADENIPWNCRRLVVGSGIYGSLPVMDEVRQRAREMGVELIVLPTKEAAKHLNDAHTNLVLHLTC